MVQGRDPTPSPALRVIPAPRGAVSTRAGTPACVNHTAPPPGAEKQPRQKKPSVIVCFRMEGGREGGRVFWDFSNPVRRTFLLIWTRSWAPVRLSARGGNGDIPRLPAAGARRVWSDPPRAARWAESGSFPRSRLARRPLCAPCARRTEARLRGVSPFPRVSPQWRPRLGFRVAFLVFASSSSSDREAPRRDRVHLPRTHLPGTRRVCRRTT